MKKRNIVLAIFVLTILISAGILKFKNKETKIESIPDLVHLENIDKMDLVQAGTGKVKEITDPETLKSIKEYIYSLKIKERDREESTGFQYMLRFYQSDHIEGIITFVNPELISVNGSYYDIIDSSGCDAWNYFGGNML